MLAMLLLSGALGFQGVKGPEWNWKAAAVSYGSAITFDFTLTRIKLNSGEYVEANERLQTLRAQIVGSSLSFAVAMALDRAMFWVHPKAPWVLRIGFGVHRGLAQMQIQVVW